MDSQAHPPFHLALPVTDLAAARHFYCIGLGCASAREDARWLDIDFYGHQLSLHLVDRPEPACATNPVDHYDIPVRHFGVVLSWVEWHALRDRLVEREIDFLVPPHLRFVGAPGEQATLFILDPSGNGLEFKSFRDPSRLFAVSLDD